MFSFPFFFRGGGSFFLGGPWEFGDVVEFALAFCCREGTKSGSA